MKTLQEIKDQVAQEHGYANWDIVDTSGKAAFINLVVFAVIEEDRKDCAFRVISDLFEAGVLVPDSKILKVIKDRPLPELL